MEQGIVSILGNVGVAGIGYIFMYVLLKHHLESSNKTVAAVDKLCDKIDELVKSNFKLQKDNSESANQAILAYAETKEYYTKTDHKLDRMRNDIEEIKVLVARIFDKVNSSVPVGQILVRQGVISQEELEKALDEQRNYI